MKAGNILQQWRTRLLSIPLFRRPLQVVLLLAFINGLLYFLLVPAWWHYDEPGQFEYVWLAANRPAWPKAGEHDEAMRREMAHSMQRSGWYALRNYTPDFSSSKSIWIGAPQTGGQPAYYFVASLPLRLMRGADITLQYDVVRLTSLLLYVLTILVIWKALGELVPEGHALQWIVTGFIALLPAFADIMTSVNDDVGAVLVSCIFLWLSFQLIKRGFSIARLLFWGITLALCYLTKNTTWFAFAVAPFVLLAALLRGRMSRLLWAIAALLVLAAAVITFEGGGSASWFQNRTQTPPLRVTTPHAVLGTHAFQIDYSTGRMPQQTGQYLSADLIRSLRGTTVTLGVWIWADEPAQVRAPVLRFATRDRGFVDTVRVPLKLQPRPIFYRIGVQVPSDANYAIVIPPYLALKGTNGKVYFDGVVLAEGAHSTTPPQFNDPSAVEGSWDGRLFSNLIDNGSAEQPALRVRPAVDQATVRLLAKFGSLSSIFSTLGDWRGTSWYYRDTFFTMLRTFWASVAADKFNLPGTLPNNFLLVLTVLGLLGAARMLWRKRRELRWDILFILFAALVIAWAMAALRGVSSLSLTFPIVTRARYAFPAILPTALLICAGWLEWLEWLSDRFAIPRKIVHLIPVGFMMLLSLFTLFNIVKFFHPSVANIKWLFPGAAVLGLAVWLFARQANRLNTPSS